MADEVKTAEENKDLLTVVTADRGQAFIRH